MDRVEVVAGTGKVTTTMTHYLKMRISWLLTRTANSTQLISYMTVQKKCVNLAQTTHETQTVPKLNNRFRVTRRRTWHNMRLKIVCEQMVDACPWNRYLIWQTQNKGINLTWSCTQNSYDTRTERERERVVPKQSEQWCSFIFELV